MLEGKNRALCSRKEFAFDFSFRRSSVLLLFQCDKSVTTHPLCHAEAHQFSAVQGVLEACLRSRAPAARSHRQYDRNASAPPDRELDRLLDLEPIDVEGSHQRVTIAVTARDKLLVFLARRDVEATNNESERARRSSGRGDERVSL